jgi:hypothetical protein
VTVNRHHMRQQALDVAKPALAKPALAKPALAKPA